MKKLLPKIGLYVGTFVVINVAMYFLLMFTQPEPVAHDEEAGADSTLTHEEAVPEIHEDAEFDHAPDEEQVQQDLAEESHDDHSEDHSGDVHAEDSGEQTGMDTEQETAQIEQPQDSEPNVIDLEVALEDSPKSAAEIAKLAKVLEGMKPAEAAVIAERLPTNTIVELVMRMKSRSGAKMMASLPVPVAASVATKMAELSGTKNPS